MKMMFAIGLILGSMLCIEVNGAGLIAASYNGNLEWVLKELNDGQDVDQSDWRGWSGLDFAVGGNYSDVVELLIMRGATMQPGDAALLEKALSWNAFVESNRIKTVQLLLNNRAEVSEKSLSLALSRDKEIHQLLLKHKAEISTPS